MGLFPSSLSSPDGCSSLYKLSNDNIDVAAKVEHSLKEEDAHLNVASVVAILSDPKKLYQQYFAFPASVRT